MERFVRARCDECNHEWKGWYKKGAHVKCPECTGANNFKPSQTHPSWNDPNIKSVPMVGGSKLSKGVELAWQEMQKMGYTDMKDNNREGDVVIPKDPISTPQIQQPPSMPDNPVSRYMQQSGGFYQNNNQQNSIANGFTQSEHVEKAIESIKSTPAYADPLKSGARIVE